MTLFYLPYFTKFNDLILNTSDQLIASRNNLIPWIDQRMTYRTVIYTKKPLELVVFFKKTPIKKPFMAVLLINKLKSLIFCSYCRHMNHIIAVLAVIKTHNIGRQ